jgi:ankyrin repeat protein
VNARDKDGNTPLHFAASWSRPDVIRLLLDHGADPTIANYTGATPVIVALQKAALVAARPEEDAARQEVVEVSNQLIARSYSFIIDRATATLN